MATRLGDMPTVLVIVSHIFRAEAWEGKKPGEIEAEAGRLVGILRKNGDIAGERAGAAIEAIERIAATLALDSAESGRKRPSVGAAQWNGESRRRRVYNEVTREFGGDGRTGAGQRPAMVDRIGDLRRLVTSWNVANLVESHLYWLTADHH